MVQSNQQSKNFKYYKKWNISFFQSIAKSIHPTGILEQTRQKLGPSVLKYPGDASKRRNRKGYRKVHRILQSPIPGTQEGRRPSSDHQPKNLKQSYNKRKIQDGDTACNQGSADPRGLGHLNRHQRRLFSYSSPSYGKEISPVHTPPGSLPIQRPSVRPDVRAKGNLQSHGDYRSNCPSTEHQSTLIPGRLAPQSTILLKMSPRYCNNPASSQQPRIHNQRREIRTSSDAAIFIPGRGLRPGAGSTLPYTPKISSNRNSLRITEKASSSGSPVSS